MSIPRKDEQAKIRGIEVQLWFTINELLCRPDLTGGVGSERRKRK